MHWACDVGQTLIHANMQTYHLSSLIYDWCRAKKECIFNSDRSFIQCSCIIHSKAAQDLIVVSGMLKSISSHNHCVWLKSFTPTRYTITPKGTVDGHQTVSSIIEQMPVSITHLPENVPHPLWHHWLVYLHLAVLWQTESHLTPRPWVLWSHWLSHNFQDISAHLAAV